ncbi:hypothetical protein [Hymenobacter sp. BRD67]|uniref:hypothetical protein n=1 Tax=Hymenobacter sp. BRD67 TaxID=2675877 RepID=UPI001563B219|nr:hypothetical protein [Hymenobacter sp. BRD67]QKG53241.1 hypothetical protein GKZ67_12385 [Hymenobacter sp. BRD67]
MLTPKVVGGAGRLDGPQSYVRSESLVFTNDSYSGKKALLSVKSAQAGKPALMANEVDISYDLKRGFAEFKREEGSKSTIDLPYTDFRSSLSEGRWDFKKKQVILRASRSDSVKSYFASTLPEQKGLKFRAGSAIYDLAKYKLQANNVHHIAIADSWVLPDSGRVVVLPGGRFQQMKNARVVMDSVTKFHKLYLGDLVLKSRYEFEGQAKYTFKYANGDSVALTFSDFRPDSAGGRLLADAGGKKKGGFLKSRKTGDVPTSGNISLTGAAKVQANDNFNLAPRIGYQGEVTLNSQRRGLAFQGEVKLNFNKNKSGAEWVPMLDTINPKSIAIQFENPKGEDGAPLTAGLLMSDEAPGVYPLYFGSPVNTTDYPIFKVDGTLRYDAKAGRYSLSRADLADPNQYEGAALTFDEASRRLGWRGPFNPISSEKNFTITGAAVGTGAPDSAAYRMQAMLGFDIVMPLKGVETMAANIVKLTKSAGEAIGGNPNDLFNIGQLGGNQAAKSFADHKMGAAPDALQKLSPKFLRTLVINHVDLRWNAHERAWYSVGRIGLGGVGKQPFNALMNGMLEIKRVEGQDYVELYLEPSPGYFYYFRYEKGVFVTQSLDEQYNYAISSKAKYDYSTALEYGAFLGALDEVETFRTRFRRTYFNESASETMARRKATAAAEERLAQEKAAQEEAAAAAAEAKKNKKRKPDEAASDDTNAFGEPPMEAASKKKKKKDNDPYGDGVITPAAAEPAKKPKKKKDNDPFAESDVPPVAPAPKKSAPAPVAPAPAVAKPAPAAGAKPAADSLKATAPATSVEAPAAAPVEAPVKKQKADMPDPTGEPGIEPDRKSKKKKKKGEEDPFGDS